MGLPSLKGLELTVPHPRTAEFLPTPPLSPVLVVRRHERPPRLTLDVAGGAQVFFSSDREEDVAFLVSLRHHWRRSDAPMGIGGH